MERQCAVYILASKRNGTLYVGSTRDLLKRVWQHQNKLAPGFTEKYNVKILVFYELHSSYDNALNRERQIKKWNRDWKLLLIEKRNRGWCDLYDEII